eukprot:gene1494-1735_t
MTRLTGARTPIFYGSGAWVRRGIEENRRAWRTSPPMNGKQICPHYLVSAAPTQWTSNGHYYEYITGASSYASALTAIASKTFTTPSGQELKGYLATVSCEDEFKFLLTVFGSTPNAGTTANGWISGQKNTTNSDIWNYNSGGENGQVMFQQSTGRCYGYCPFDQISTAVYPSFTQTVAFIYMASTVPAQLRTDTTNGASRSYFVEYGGLETPFVPSVSTQGGVVTITQLNGYNLASLQVTFGASSTPCNSGSASDASSFTCTVPAGSGVTTVTITDGVKVPYTTRYEYQGAYIESLYPGKVAGDIITLVGDNFGTDPSAISISTGEVSKAACTKVKVEVPHTVVTCALGHTPQPGNTADTLFPITISINGLKSVQNRMAFYDAANLQMIRIAGASESYAQVTQMINIAAPLEGATAYTGGILKGQSGIINTVYNFVTGSDYVYTGLVYDGVGAQGKGFYFAHPNDPRYQTLAILGNTTCQPMLECQNGVYIDNKNNWKTGDTIRYTHKDSIYIAGGPNEGELAFYGQIPTITASAPLALYNTSGANMVLNVGFNGFRYSKRTFSIEGIVMPSTVAQVSTNSVSLPIPGGTGANPRHISVSVENYFFNGVATYAYYAPYITSVQYTSQTSTIVIQGLNLGNNGMIEVTVGLLSCTNPTIVTPHTSISCTVAASTGANLPVVVTVSGQVQENTITFSFPAPIISSVTQDNLLLTVVGSNLGSQSSVIVANMATSISPNSLIGNTLVFTAPVNSMNGLFNITVDSQVSNSLQLDFVPQISAVTGITATGGPITISGSFLTGLRLNGTATVISVKVGTSTCTSPIATGTSITCTLDKGTGTQALSVTIDNKKSRSYDITFPTPTITSYQQVGSDMIIFGTNFGTNLNSIIVQFYMWHADGKVNPTKILSSPERIVATIPSVAKNGPINLFVGGVSSNQFTVALTPVLTSAPTIPTIGGVLTVAGNCLNYKDDPGATLPTIVELDDVVITGSMFGGAYVVVPFPGGVGSQHNLSVTVGTLTGFLIVSYSVPVITKATITNNIVSVVGSNFGNNSAVVTTLSPYTIKSVNHTLATVTVPEANGPISLTVAGQISNSVNVVLTPSVVSVIPVVVGGGSVFISGTNLMLTRTDGTTATSTITIGDTVCSNPSSSSTTQISCTLPAIDLEGVPVTIIIDGVSSNTDVYYTSIPSVTTAPTTNPGTTDVITTTTTGVATTTTGVATTTTDSTTTSNPTTSPSTSPTMPPGTSTTTDNSASSNKVSAIMMTIALMITLFF